MNEEKEQWIEDVISSAKGSHRAKPAKDVFARIEQEIDQPEGKLISMSQKRLAIAAAVILLILNIIAIQGIVHTDPIDSQEKETLEMGTSYQLISDYKIYD